jgi:2-methylcitrate dehydratase PrpD
MSRSKPSRISRRALVKGSLAVPGLGLALNAVGDAQSDPQASSGPPLALRLARLFHGIKFEDLSETSVTHAKMILASTLAGAAYGPTYESARIVRDLAKEQGGHPEATIWYDGTKLPLLLTARVNSMLSDSAASDDSDLRNVAHTGTALTSLSLAIGEKTGASGRDILTAMVAGYESAGRFGDAIRAGRPGLHASMVVAFGGVVAASRLLGLTPEQMAHALAITSTTMGGILIGTDSWAREYMAGNAAMCALNAAMAAKRGFTVNPDLLEAKGGFLDTYGNPKTDLAVMARPAGPEWDIVKFLAIKLIPGAHAIHASAEAAVNVAKQSNAQPEDITKVLISGPHKNTATYADRAPKDMVEAIHSMPYFVCSALVDRDFSWVHVTPAKINSAAVAKLIERVEYGPDPEPVEYQWNWGGTVTIYTKSGQKFTSTVQAPRGSGPRGIQWADVEAKYNTLMPQSGLPAKRIADILKLIQGFEQAKDAAQLVRLLHGKA